jgi:uncharacterized SAM-binding protein YcdF (DUF218 family)
MPPSTIRTRGRLRRNLIILFALLAAGGLFAFDRLGRFMASEDPLTKADAIFVMAGTRIDRPLEAADLYLEGYAPRVVVTRDFGERAIAAAARRGVKVLSDFELATNALRDLGVPADALITPDRVHDNTAQEAQTLRALALQHSWHRVIVVSSRYHLRRVRLACRRELRGTDVEILVHGSRYDSAVPQRWWRRRGDLRLMLSEVPKLLGYALGFGA